MVDYEKELFLAFDRLGVDDNYRSNFMKYFDTLREFDTYKWEHSVRVGLGCEALVRKYFPEWPVRELFGAGAFNDIGDMKIDVEVVQKADMPNSNFTSEDYEKMKLHVVEGYNMIVGDFPDEARIMLFHHMRTRGYPEGLPERNLECRVSEEEAREYGHLVELVDFADALNRRNGRYGELDVLKKKEKLFEFFPEYRKIIEESYASGAFS